jgi:hypothetical protein
MSLSHLRNIFLYWHGLRIYFGSGYIFLVCRGVRGPSFSKKLGIVCFQSLQVHFQIWKGALFQMTGSRVHFHIWKYAHFQMKNSNKIRKK